MFNALRSFQSVSQRDHLWRIFRGGVPFPQAPFIRPFTETDDPKKDTEHRLCEAVAAFLQRS